MNVKSAPRPVVVYLRDHPGAVSVIVGEGAILLARAGVHVTEAQLTAVAAILMPLLLAYFHVARKAGKKSRAAAMERWEASMNRHAELMEQYAAAVQLGGTAEVKPRAPRHRAGTGK